MTPEIVIYRSDVVSASELVEGWMKTPVEEWTLWYPEAHRYTASKRGPLLPACTIGPIWKLGGFLIWWLSNHIVLLCDSGRYRPNARVDSYLMYYEHCMGLRPSYFWVIGDISCQFSDSQSPSAATKTTRIPGNTPDVMSCPHSKAGTMSLLNIKWWLSAGSFFCNYVALT
jgi:hypothetical protein